MHKGVSGFCAAKLMDILCPIIVFFAPAEGDYFLIKAFHSLHGIFIVAVYDKCAGVIFGKFAEGFDCSVDIAEIIKVVVIDVENYRNIVRKLEESINKFAGFNNEDIAFSCSSASAKSFYFSADECAWVESAFEKNLGYHAAGGGFSVGSGNAKSFAVSS